MTDAVPVRAGEPTGRTRARPSDAALLRPSPLRPAIWCLHLSLPVLGLWLLLAQPEADLRWEHHHAHFGLVLTTAVIAFAIGALIAVAARAHADARIFLVACAFLVIAGFFAVHALTTPMIIIDTPNLGWTASTSVGLAIASVFAVASSFAHVSGVTAWPLRHARLLLGVVATILCVWLVLSLAEVPPFDDIVLQDEARGELSFLASITVGLYAVAAVRYWLAYRRRPAAVLMSVLTAWALFAEASAATALGRSWQLSWWLWHVLLVVAFGFVGYSAHVQYRREGSAGGLFRGVALDETMHAIRADYEHALERLVAEMHAQHPDEHELARLTAMVAERFGFTEAQRGVLEQAAMALARERETTEQLSALVTVSHSTSVLDDEDALIERARHELDRRFRRDRVTLALISNGAVRALGEPPPPELTAQVVATREPAERGQELVHPLLVKDEVAGVVAFERRRGRFDDRDRAMAASVASQLSVQIENARLYSTIDSLFRRYLAPSVVTRLLADPDQAALGGALVEITVLFGDLRGFTSYSEQHTPEEVVSLLNRYYGAIIPCILASEGTVMSYAGDAVMAVFNAPTRQPDHVERAARTALAIRDAIAELTRGEDVPRFGIGVNTGPAVVGNIGAELRDYTAIGDSVNVAARLESTAGPGEVIIGALTRDRLGASAVCEAAGDLELKGKAGRVPAWRLLGLT